jgi:uncharacterized LabA/DUF88 family protein
MKRTAILVDWENLRREIEVLQRQNRVTGFDYNNPDHLVCLFHSFLDYEEEELYRIFFYTSPPFHPEEFWRLGYEKCGKRQDLQEKFTLYFEKHLNSIEGAYEKSSHLLSELAIQDYLALRKGTLKIAEILDNGRPVFAQKQVDMLMGIDIAQISLMKLVDRVIVFCKDTDMKPALKLARTSGIQTVIADLGGISISRTLRTHNDIVRYVSLGDIVTKLLFDED